MPKKPHWNRKRLFHSPLPDRATVWIALLVAVLLVIFWAVAADAAQSPAPRVIEISAKKYEFTPSVIRVSQGASIELKVHSEDVTHGLKLDLYPEGAKAKGAPGLTFGQPDQNGKVIRGADQVLDFTARQPGTYRFHCARICGMGHGHMKGELIVDP